MRIGIDLGGTKTELIALNRQGMEQMRFRRSTPASDYAATIHLIAGMVQQAEAELGAAASIGIGTPGAISLKTGRMKNCNSTCLNGRPLREDLEHALKREIRLSNDANCFALSEAVDGAGMGDAVVFGVILGTGVGGGVAVHGQVLDGVNHIAGEWGHNPLPVIPPADIPGPACYCGRRGCIEAWLSGPAMQAEHRRAYGKKLTAGEIAAAAQAGDVECLQTLEIYCERLARALSMVINIIDPDVIVLGGGLANIGMLYSRVPLLWHRYIFSDEIRTRLLPPQHGDSSGVRGAARLWEKS